MMEISPAIWIPGCSRFANTLTSPSFPKEAMSHTQHLCCVATQCSGGMRRAKGIIIQLRGKIFVEFYMSSSAQRLWMPGARRVSRDATIWERNGGGLFF